MTQNKNPAPVATGSGAEACVESSSDHSAGASHTATIDPVIIAKNQRESLRLSIDEFKGRRLLSARLWFKPSDEGDLRPGKDGWAIAIDKLPEVIEALRRLEGDARREGLL